MRKTLLLLLMLSLITATLAACFNKPKTESVLLPAESITQSTDVVSKTDSQATSQETSQATSKVSVPKMINVYTAFGDSIARGAGLTTPETHCYPVIVFEKIKASQKTKQPTFQNFAVDGQTSPQLLELLKTKGTIIASSDVITISTGANNILGVFIGKAASIFEKYGFSMSDVYNVGGIFSDLMSGSANPDSYQNVLMVFSELNDYISSDEFDVQIATAAAQFKADLPKIISEIRSKNKDAFIVVNTIYNPYKHLAIKMSGITLFSPVDDTEKAVKALNKVIKDEEENLGYIIAPVYESFNAHTGSARLENAYFSFEALGATNIDVHPTKAGHELIAEIVFDTIKQYTK